MGTPIINTVIFDMGGVIFQNGTREAIKILISKYSVEETIAKDIYTGPLSWDLRAGLMNSDEYWKFVKQKYEKCEFYNKLNLKNLWYEQFTPLKGMIDLLRSLKEKVRLGVISGNIIDRVGYLFEKYNLQDFFDFEAYSFTYNLHKNDFNLYKRVISDFNVNPNQTLFIDDNLDCVEAAKQCGLKTHLFTGCSQLKTELENYGI